MKTARHEGSLGTFGQALCQLVGRVSGANQWEEVGNVDVPGSLRYSRSLPTPGVVQGSLIVGSLAGQPRRGPGQPAIQFQHRRIERLPGCLGPQV